MGRLLQDLWSKAELDAPLAGADIDMLVLCGAAVHKDRIGLFGGKRRTAAADIAGEREDFLEVDHLHMFVA